MNKKVIISIIVVLIVIGGGLFIFLNKDNKQVDNSNKTEMNDNNKNDEKSDNNMNNKSLVLYFSATGTTKKVAELIREVTNSDIEEIIPRDKYTNEDLNYNNDNSRANIEQNDNNARPEIASNIDISNYDVIYLGYPIWWGNVPKIILTLIENNNFEGKTIIPFCTSGGSGIEESINTLKSYNLNIKNGKRFSSGTDKEDVSSWINSLN